MQIATGKNCPVQTRGIPKSALQMNLHSNIDALFGSTIDHFRDPWYRFDRMISLLERHARISSGARWLDVGCQLGQFLGRVQERHEIVPTGIDNFDETGVIEVCRRYFGIHISEPRQVINDSWRYLCRQIDQTGFDIDEKFQFISALEILEHMIDTDAFLEECRNHLEADGLLMISTPNINSLRNRLQVPLGVYPAGLEYRNKIHHVRLYNVPMLIAHLREHGFEPVAVAGVSFARERWLRHAPVRAVDSWLADRLPSLCGGIIGIFRLRS